MAGRHDFIATAEMAEEMVKYLPNAQLKIFEESGHFALIEEPKAFHQAIKDFTVSK
jgi:proline iminopeptidase